MSRLLVLVTYDVNTKTTQGRKRLRQVARCCVAHGQRVQNSVFECSLDEVQYVILRDRLSSLIDGEKDSLRFYNLGNHYQRKIVHVGAKPTYDPGEPLIL
ncbi:CRISPR-associated endonuclease Cas2 [Megasphaera cerevisiae]|uniref:CRISPR-associated endonuclease Cas2 n=1 Tax=Megasphaera cerevisiae TaxID=39029 RepID=UPI00209AFCAE|nr:CRISPR-associated endonuclease Cas2 [Megasphaera cerevisiae]MCI1750838.1 CRISPR-associated endonuclease Cas2 [Megasphaera cerevisiae]